MIDHDIYLMIACSAVFSGGTFLFVLLIFCKVWGSNSEDDIRKIKKLLKGKTPKP